MNGTKVRKPKIWITAFLLTAIVTLFYLNCLSQNWSGDGIRHIRNISSSVFPRPTSFRWFLFPVVEWFFYHTALSLGWHLPAMARFFYCDLSLAKDGHIAAVLSVQLTNAVLAGATVGCYYILIISLLKDRFMAMAGALTFAFSACFVMHATDATEPVASLLLFFFALFLAIAAVKTKDLRLSFCCGFIFSIAAGAYQLVLLNVPGVLLIFWLFSVPLDAQRRLIEKLKHVVLFSLGFLMCQAMLLWSYKSLLGFSWLESFKEYFSPQTAGLWGNFSNLKKIYYLFLGLSMNLARTFTDWNGFGVLVKEREWFSIGGIVSFCLLIVLLSLWALVYLFRNWRGLEAQLKKFLAVALFLFIFPVAFSLWFYPGYDKFWIQPLMAYIFILSVTLSNLLSHVTRPHKIRFAVIAFVLFLVFVNFYYLIWPRHCNPNRAYLTFTKINRLISPGDLLVTNDWGTFFKNFSDVNVFSLVSEAMGSFEAGSDIVLKLDRATNDTLKRGKHVYFFDVFEYNDLLAKLNFRSEKLEHYYKDSRPVALIFGDKDGMIQKELRIYSTGGAI